MVEGVADINLGEPNRKLERREFVEDSSHQRHVRRREVTLETDSVHPYAAAVVPLQLPDPRDVLVDRRPLVAASLNHVEIIQEQSRQRVKLTRRREKTVRRVFTQSAFVEVEVKHLVAHVPMHELSSVPSHKAPDSPVNRRPEIFSG